MTMDGSGQATRGGPPSLAASPPATPAAPAFSPSLPGPGACSSQGGHRAAKRSFDVAFLMAPDENLARRQQLRLVAANALLRRSPPPPDAARPRPLFEQTLLLTRAPPPPPPPPAAPLDLPDVRSAFTKVGSAGSPVLAMAMPTSPSSSLSPDHVAYQNSLSPPTSEGHAASPAPPPFVPSPTAKPFPTTVTLLAPQPPKATYTSSPFLLHEPKAKVSNGLCGGEGYLLKAAHYDKELLSGFGAAKLRPAPAAALYPHADSVAAYSTVAAAAASYPFAATGFPPLLAATNPAAAAAMVSASLLPPSFAALSLPAQNVCAKCNISFRMTSDLVYHMRSQHKSEGAAGGDALRRRRDQEKLKCPVCSESFRERHHLTRHMTAHQDKDEDEEREGEGEGAEGRRRGAGPHK